MSPTQLIMVKVMSYDLMNRRDKKTHHHTSVADSSKVIDHYLAIGAPAKKMNRKLHETLALHMLSL